MQQTCKRLVAATLCLLMLAGCAATAQDTQPQAPDDAATAADETTPDTSGSTALDEADGSKVLLVVSFGTSYNETRDKTIGAVEAHLAAAYPDYEVRRAFTSGIIIGILAEREGLEIDNVTEAMQRLVADGVREVVVQPTHVMNGYEYNDILDEVAPFRDQFDRFHFGAQLLNSDADFDAVADILAGETQGHRDENTAIVFMGHGTEHESNAGYAKLQQHLTAAGHDNIFIGTVEAEPELEAVMEQVRQSGATRVVLLPLMVVAGDHATNDMAGDEEGSWKSEFEAAGYEVECVLKGLGEYPGIQELYIQHVADALAQQTPA